MYYKHLIPKPVQSAIDENKIISSETELCIIVCKDSQSHHNLQYFQIFSLLKYNFKIKKNRTPKVICMSYGVRNSFNIQPSLFDRDSSYGLRDSKFKI